MDGKRRSGQTHKPSEKICATAAAAVAAGGFVVWPHGVGKLGGEIARTRISSGPPYFPRTIETIMCVRNST